MGQETNSNRHQTSEAFSDRDAVALKNVRSTPDEHQRRKSKIEQHYRRRVFQSFPGGGTRENKKHQKKKNEQLTVGSRKVILRGQMMMVGNSSTMGPVPYITKDKPRKSYRAGKTNKVALQVDNKRGHEEPRIFRRIK